MGLLVKGADSSHAKEPSGARDIQCVAIIGYENHFFTFQADSGTLRWRVMRINNDLEVVTVTSGAVSDGAWTSWVRAVPVRAGIVAIHNTADRIETWRWTGSSVLRSPYDFPPQTEPRSNASGIGAYGTSGRLLRIWPSGTFAGRGGTGYGQFQWGRAFEVSSLGALSAITGEQNFWSDDEFERNGYAISAGISMHSDNGYGLALGLRYYEQSGWIGARRGPGGYSFFWNEANDTFQMMSGDTGESVGVYTGSGSLRENDYHQVASGYSSWITTTYDNVYEYDTGVAFYDHDEDGTYHNWTHSQGTSDNNKWDRAGDAHNLMKNVYPAGANDNDYFVGVMAGDNGHVVERAVEITGRQSNFVFGRDLPNDPAAVDGTTARYPVGAGQVGAYYVITWANASTRYWRTYYDISKLSVPYLRMNRRADASRSSGRHDPSVQDSIRNPGGGVFV